MENLDRKECCFAFPSIDILPQRWMKTSQRNAKTGYKGIALQDCFVPRNDVKFNVLLS